MEYTCKRNGPWWWRHIRHNLAMEKLPVTKFNLLYFVWHLSIIHSMHYVTMIFNSSFILFLLKFCIHHSVRKNCQKIGPCFYYFHTFSNSRSQKQLYSFHIQYISITYFNSIFNFQFVNHVTNVIYVKCLRRDRPFILEP